jgi:hypothetical protein
MTTFDYDSIADLPLGAWRWPHFDAASEWACHATGRLLYVPEFMDLLEALRAKASEMAKREIALPIISGYRSPMHDREVGLSGNPGAGPHTTGCAADIRLTNPDLGVVIAAALALGFTGFGLRQLDGSDLLSRSLHLDTVHKTVTFWNY